VAGGGQIMYTPVSKCKNDKKILKFPYTLKDLSLTTESTFCSIYAALGIL
jgi:hypothetical protein